MQQQQMQQQMPSHIKESSPIEEQVNSENKNVTELFKQRANIYDNVRNTNEMQIKEFQLKNQQQQEQELRKQLKEQQLSNTTDINSFIGDTNKIIVNELDDKESVDKKRELVLIETKLKNEKQQLTEIMQVVENEKMELSQMKEQIQHELLEKNNELNNNIRRFNENVEITKNDLEQKNKDLTKREKQLYEQENNITKKNNIMYDTILNYCNKKDNNIITNIMIDSRSRDYSKYTNSSCYSINLDKELQNIQYIELIQYSFTNSPNIINNTNNIFKLIENNLENDSQNDNDTKNDNTQKIYTLEIIQQNYNCMELAAELERVINDTSDHVYNVSYINNTFKISSELSFELIFENSDFNDVLGFENNKYSDKNEYTSDKLPYVNPEEYINLNISNINLGKLFFKNQTYIYYKFDEPISLKNMDINIFNYKNKLCDLRNSEHIFYMKVHCHKDE